VTRTQPKFNVSRFFQKYRTHFTATKINTSYDKYISELSCDILKLIKEDFIESNLVPEYSFFVGCVYKLQFVEFFWRSHALVLNVLCYNQFSTNGTTVACCKYTVFVPAIKQLQCSNTTTTLTPTPLCLLIISSLMSFFVRAVNWFFWWEIAK
jgi:hypothetical protein